MLLDLAQLPEDTSFDVVVVGAGAPEWSPPSWARPED